MIKKIPAYSQKLSASRKSGIPRGTNRGAGKRYPLNAKRFWISICSFAFCVLSFTLICHAEEITILYTGETHAMLYPCDCPIEPDGGIARRVSLVKQLRKSSPDALLLDSGGFFAGGLMDEHTQNTQLDIERTLVNLKAMELMKYDALALGDDEFNFGKEFLEENINKTNLKFLSCNMQFGKILPYTIKEVQGVKIGIIGVTSPYAMQKAGGIKFSEPKFALKNTLEELKKKNTDIIILLSHLGENEDLNLIKEVSGVDILISGHSRHIKEESFVKINSTLLLRPSWQGRRLGKLSLTLNENKIANYNVEELRLSDKIIDDPEILRILPDCFADRDCKKKGLIGACQDQGSINARCLFGEVSKVSLRIIAPKECRACNTDEVIKFLKAQFPGLVVSYLYYPEAKASKMIKDFKLKTLPLYFLGREIEKEKVFAQLKEKLEIKGDFYMLRPEFGGISYFLDRAKINGKLDLFISLYDKNSKELLSSVRDFQPAVHFLAAKQKDMFDAAAGAEEVEEYMRAVCIQKYYPEKFWDYISCRAGKIYSAWWDDCIAEVDTDKIKICAKSQEGRGLLEDNANLNKELQVMFGPTYLLDNQEIFGISGVPSKEDLKKIFNKKIAFGDDFYRRS